jgi:RNA polymerase sigma factor FliA
MNAICAFTLEEDGLLDGHTALSAAEEQRWMMQYLPLVKRIVGQLSIQANQVLDRKDMEQIGLIGLLEGLRRYGVPDDHFIRFASLRIRGAILDELRRQDWRPRQVRQQVHKTRDAIRELTRGLGREPSEDEIREHAGIDHGEYAQFRQDEALDAVHSLDELLQNGHTHPVDETQPFDERFINERTLAQALERLDERERTILTLYYRHELNLKEIALVLELSDARICQLMKQALNKARTFLTQPER